MLAGLLVAALATPAVAQRDGSVRGYLADSSLAFLAPLVGEWSPVLPDSVLRQLGFRPIAGSYQWTVGGRALRFRESYPAGTSPDSARLDGMVYWNPATEVVEFTAVAGPGDGQGRLFRGEYRLLEDGVVERVYDVYYRTAADTPGEDYGGLRRRYRERFRLLSPDSMATQLDWWHDGAWRPFGRFATGTQVRWEG
jgi:hypothetical protein